MDRTHFSERVVLSARDHKTEQVYCITQSTPYRQLQVVPAYFILRHKAYSPWNKKGQLEEWHEVRERRILGKILGLVVVIGEYWKRYDSELSWVGKLTVCPRKRKITFHGHVSRLRIEWQNLVWILLILIMFVQPRQMKIKVVLDHKVVILGLAKKTLQLLNERKKLYRKKCNFIN